jgi:hypothetical protein
MTNIKIQSRKKNKIYTTDYISIVYISIFYDKNDIKNMIRLSYF